MTRYSLESLLESQPDIFEPKQKRITAVGKGIWCIGVLSVPPESVSNVYLSRNNLGDDCMEQLCELSKLNALSLAENRLHSTKALQCLSKLKLRSLSLEGNPVERLPFYRLHVIALFPYLTNLDGRVVTADERKKASRILKHEEQIVYMLTLHALLVHRLQHIKWLHDIHVELEQLGDRYTTSSSSSSSSFSSSPPPPPAQRRRLLKLMMIDLDPLGCEDVQSAVRRHVIGIHRELTHIKRPPLACTIKSWFQAYAKVAMDQLDLIIDLLFELSIVSDDDFCGKLRDSVGSVVSSVSSSRSLSDVQQLLTELLLEAHNANPAAEEKQWSISAAPSPTKSMHCEWPPHNRNGDDEDTNRNLELSILAKDEELDRLHAVLHDLEVKVEEKEVHLIQRECSLREAHAELYAMQKRTENSLTAKDVLRGRCAALETQLKENIKLQNDLEAENCRLQALSSPCYLKINISHQSEVEQLEKIHAALSTDYEALKIALEVVFINQLNSSKAERFCECQVSKRVLKLWRLNCKDRQRSRSLHSSFKQRAHWRLMREWLYAWHHATHIEKKVNNMIICRSKRMLSQTTSVWRVALEDAILLRGIKVAAGCMWQTSLQNRALKALQWHADNCRQVFLKHPNFRLAVRLADNGLLLSALQAWKAWMYDIARPQKAAYRLAETWRKHSTLSKAFIAWRQGVLNLKMCNQQCLEAAMMHNEGLLWQSLKALHMAVVEAQQKRALIQVALKKYECARMQGIMAIWYQWTASNKARRLKEEEDSKVEAEKAQQDAAQRRLQCVEEKIDLARAQTSQLLGAFSIWKHFIKMARIDKAVQAKAANVLHRKVYRQKNVLFAGWKRGALVVKLEKSTDQLREEMRKVRMLQGNIYAKSQAINTLEQQCQALQVENSKLESFLQDARNQKDLMAAALAHADQQQSEEIARNVSQLKDLRRALEDAETESKDAKHIMNLSLAEQDLLKTQHATMLCKLQESDAALFESRQAHGISQGQLKAACRDIETLQYKMSRSTAECASIKAALESARVDRQDMLQQLERAKSQWELLNEDFAKSHQEKNELLLVVEELQKQLDTEKIQRRHLEQAHKAAMKSSSRLAEAYQLEMSALHTLERTFMAARGNYCVTPNGQS